MPKPPKVRGNKALRLPMRNSAGTHKGWGMIPRARLAKYINATREI